MNHKWVPEWATHYALEREKHGLHLTVHFLENEGISGIVSHQIKPVSELAKDLAIADVCQQIKEKPLEDRMAPRNKYDREIVPGLWVDVYDVLDAFTVTRSAVAHAVKKLLAPGQRGVKDELVDLEEARDSITRAVQKFDEWV